MSIASYLIIWVGLVTLVVNLQTCMDLQYFGQIVSVTHVMSIKFKNNFKIDLIGAEYYTQLKFKRRGLGEGRGIGIFMGNVDHKILKTRIFLNIKFLRTMFHLCLFSYIVTCFDAGKTNMETTSDSLKLICKVHGLAKRNVSLQSTVRRPSSGVTALRA